MKEYLTILESCPLFRGVMPQEIEAMLACLGAWKIGAGKDQIIFQEGDPAAFVGVVLSGTVRIIREDFYGNRTVLGQIEPGQLFGESFSCAGVESLPVSAVAAQPAVVLLLDCRRILNTCSNACTFHARLIHNLLQVLAQKNLYLNQKLDITTRRTTRDKLMAFLLAQAKQQGNAAFTIPFDRQTLADYLGVERSAMSAELSKLQKEGVLETRRSWFKLL